MREKMRRVIAIFSVLMFAVNATEASHFTFNGRSYRECSCSAINALNSTNDKNMKRCGMVVGSDECQVVECGNNMIPARHSCVCPEGKTINPNGIGCEDNRLGAVVRADSSRITNNQRVAPASTAAELMGGGVPLSMPPIIEEDQWAGVEEHQEEVDADRRAEENQRFFQEGQKRLRDTDAVMIANRIMTNFSNNDVNEDTLDAVAYNRNALQEAMRKAGYPGFFEMDEIAVISKAEDRLNTIERLAREQREQRELSQRVAASSAYRGLGLAPQEKEPQALLEAPPSPIPPIEITEINIFDGSFLQRANPVAQVTPNLGPGAVPGGNKEADGSAYAARRQGGGVWPYHGAPESTPMGDRSGDTGEYGQPSIFTAIANANIPEVDLPVMPVIARPAPDVSFADAFENEDEVKVSNLGPGAAVPGGNREADVSAWAARRQGGGVSQEALERRRAIDEIMERLTEDAGEMEVLGLMLELDEVCDGIQSSDCDRAKRILGERYERERAAAERTAANRRSAEVYGRELERLEGMEDVEPESATDFGVVAERVIDLGSSFPELTRSSGWTDAAGGFNWGRAGIDAAAAVALGAVGGFVTNRLVKNSQVEKGFENVMCTVGGLPVAGWGDVFMVGPR